MSFEIRSLSVSFQNIELEHRLAILNKIDFALEPNAEHANGIVGVVGANGAGKSTLLKAIAGLDSLYKNWQRTGKIMWEGQNLSEMSPAERAKYIAFVPAVVHCSFPYKVHEIISLFFEPTQEGCVVSDEIKKSSLWQRTFNELSTGEQQYVMVLGAISSFKPILILDEALTHLDLSNRTKVIRLLLARAKSERRNITFLVDHDINFISHVCTHGILLKQGSMLDYGRVDELFTQSKMQELLNVAVAVKTGFFPHI